MMLSTEFGKVASSLKDISGEDLVTSVGAGVRWQVTQEQPMNLGVDAGYSKGDYAIYVQIGEKF